MGFGFGGDCKHGRRSDDTLIIIAIILLLIVLADSNGFRLFDAD
jgi:acid phosphatase family membrane protein YuiD